jgi:hypothetical protein
MRPAGQAVQAEAPVAE